MAFGSIEIVTLTRTQDYTTIKHNEDNKAVISQANGGQQVEKKTEQMTREVHSGDNAQWQKRKFDAKDKGSNEYAGNGGKQRQNKKADKEQVVVKGHQGFDMKI